MGDYNNIKMVCGFYISSTHLVTMILPYIKKSLCENVKIETFLEYNLTETINDVLSKLIINNEKKEKILDINWHSKKIQKYSNIEKNIKNNLENNKKINILITGSREYINEGNKIINKILNKYCNKIQDKEIKIINCYEVTEFDDNIREILDLHEFILNTSGLHKIEEVFDGYKKEHYNKQA